MITENSLRLFTNKTINESLPLANETKNAKVVNHCDLDGLVSGISMVHQLIKQGIPKSRITVELAQYGDEEKEKEKFTEKFKGKNHQFVGTVDFAKLPRIKPYESFNSLMNFKGQYKKIAFTNFIKNYKKCSYQEFKVLFTKTFNPTLNKFSEASFKKLYSVCEAYADLKDKPDLSDIDNVSIPIVKPDFVSDHHNNDNGSLSGGKKGDIGHTSPSEAEYFANKYAPALWSQDDLKAVSVIDSAGYNLDDLTNTIFLNKKFTGPNKKINLAIIISTIFDNMCKNDRQAAIWVVKNSQPSLISAYYNCMKAANFSNTRLEYLSALKNGQIEKATEMLKQFPEELTQSWSRRGEPSKPTKTYLDWRQKNAQDLARNKTGYATRQEIQNDKNITKIKKGSFRVYKNFTMQEATLAGGHLKNYPARYMGALLSFKGVRSAFTLKRFDSFIQVAKNPLYKGDVDFVKVMEQVYPVMKKAMIEAGYSSFNTERAMSVIKEKSGGHKGIFNISGFDQIKPTSKERGDAYWLANRLSKNGGDSAKEKAKQVLNKYEPINQKYKEIMNKTMDKTISCLIDKTNELYPVDAELAKALLNTDDRFEMN